MDPLVRMDVLGRKLGWMDQWLGLGSMVFFHLLFFWGGLEGYYNLLMNPLLTSNRDIQVGSCEQ